MYHVLQITTRLGRILAACAGFCPLLHGNVVRAWNECLDGLCLNRADAVSPYDQARIFALTHLAIERALVNAARDERAVGDTGRQRAAIATAAQALLAAMLPDMTAAPDVLARAQLAEIADGPEKEAGISLGREAGAAVIREWHLPAAPPVAGRPGEVLTAPSLSAQGHPGLELSWASARPFVLRKPREVSATPLYWLNMSGELVPVPGLSRARIFDAVDRRELDQLAAAWSEPPILAWNRVARAASARAGQDLRSSAQGFALLNLAMADTVQAALHWQLEFGTWQREYRETVIRDESPGASSAAAEGSSSGWSPGVQEVHLPPVRDFPAVPAAVAGAAEGVLSRAIKPGAGGIVWSARAATEAVAGNYPARHFKDYRSMAREAAFAASLDGQHSREACVSGYDLGVRIGQLAVRRKPARGRLALVR